MGLKNVIVFLVVYIASTVYSLLHLLPIIGTVLTVFDSFVFSTVAFLRDVHRTVKNALDFMITTVKRIVVFVFLPMYIPIWVVERLTHGITNKRKTGFDRSVYSLVRRIVYRLPLIGPMFRSVESLVLRLVSIPVGFIRAVKTKWNAMEAALNTVSEALLTNPLFLCVFGKAPSVHHMSVKTGETKCSSKTRDEAVPTVIQQRSRYSLLCSDEKPAVKLTRLLFAILPFGGKLITIVEAIRGFPKACFIRFEQVIRDLNSKIDGITSFVVTILYLKRFTKLESEVIKLEAKMAGQYRELKGLKSEASYYIAKRKWLLSDIAKELDKLTELESEIADRCSDMEQIIKRPETQLLAMKTSTNTVMVKLSSMLSQLVDDIGRAGITVSLAKPASCTNFRKFWRMSKRQSPIGGRPSTVAVNSRMTRATHVSPWEPNPLHVDMKEAVRRDIANSRLLTKVKKWFFPQS